MQSKLTTFLTSCPVHHSSFLQDVAYGTTTLKLESGESLEIPNMVRTSDNAGCYHCAFLLLSFPSLGQRVGVRIAGYNFIEAQAGKDTCDRRAAALNSHIRRYINESNDVKTSSDMKEAIDSHGGVKGCYSVMCNVTKGPKTWPSARWVAYSLWTTSCSLRVERSLLGGPTMLDPERSFFDVAGASRYPSRPHELTSSLVIQYS